MQIVAHPNKEYVLTNNQEAKYIAQNFNEHYKTNGEHPFEYELLGNKKVAVCTKPKEFNLDWLICSANSM
ncbi:hypothetical protein, partial [Campylobacter sputorum]|uniref:hypothetical protein n=1 Tax=Campylobacter sputorum TaxID=206 RepID=UPI00053BDE97